MTDEMKPADDSVPPKISLKKTGELSGQVPAGIPSAPKKETARLDLPFQPPSASSPKRTTSPISVAQPDEGGTVPAVQGTKTIKLAPVPSRPTAVSPLQPPASASLSEDAKRQTARIPLEAALSSRGGTITETGATGQPKTIRIKRPMQPPAAGRTGSPLMPSAEPLAPTSPEPSKSETSRVEGIPPETTTAQPTQRKTIKIRRAEDSAKPIPRSVAVARIESEAAERLAAETQSLGKVYPWIAAAALVVLCVLAYVLALQAFPNLGWKFPGQVVL